MKTHTQNHRCFLYWAIACAMALWLPGQSAWAEDDSEDAQNHAADPEKRAVVMFQEPEKFVDFRNLDRGRDQGRLGMMADLRLYLERTAEQFLSDNQTIAFTFTNIDLAGRILPVRGGAQYQRYVEDFYPPRLWFRYQVTNDQGQVVKLGDEKLVDFSFLRLASRSFVRQTDSLPYEKALLDEWWRKEFLFSIEDEITPGREMTPPKGRPLPESQLSEPLLSKPQKENTSEDVVETQGEAG
ncbi:MAG: DUF3016 domain-containing protein [Xanthomonadales bacterium]|nr:DUF3016 domain-containing protein [Xanthomonadales bacterium]